MIQSPQQQAATMHVIAAEFRGFAASTEMPTYRARMLEMAAELDEEAERLERGLRPLSKVS